MISVRHRRRSNCLSTLFQGRRRLEFARNATEAFGLFIPKLESWDPSSVPRRLFGAAGRMELAWEEPMVSATEYRTMAAEHHRLAGMCRLPESRERHLRLEQELLAIANNEECLHGMRTPQQAREPQPAR
jgi:hypothetical protein